MLALRFLSPVLLASALVTALLGHTANAQSFAIAPRINGPVDESSLATLPGNVPPKARHEFDKGEAASSTELTFVRLVLSRSAEQEANLDRFMGQQLDKSSPNYRHWLTPGEFGKLYGPADSDVAAIVAWLQSHGLKVESVSTGRTNIAFSGTVAQIEEALHTSIHSFEFHGEQFLSNISDPRIPSALAPVISGVAQLNTIRPKPYNVPGRFGQLDPATHRLVPAETPFAGPTPELTTGTAPAYSLYLVPADAATIYDTPNSLNANFASGATSDNGSGVTIGIGGDALIQPATVVNYRTKFLNDTTPPNISNVAPVAVAGQDTDEGYLDVEISGGLAPGASIFFYTSQNLVSAIDQALTDNKVDIFSLSFGSCELSLGTSGNLQLNGYWKQAATQGIAVVVATGDSGSAGCDGSPEISAVDGLQVSGFASTPYNIAVGGTDYPSLITSFTSYVNTTNGNLYGTSKGYIPESTWNMSTTIDTTTSANIPALASNNKTNIVAGGGGVSACSTNTSTNTTLGTCTSGYAKPSWQRGAGVPSDGLRDIPDVSLFAGAGADNAAWLVCTDDTFSQGGTTLTGNCAGSTFSFYGFGGTSTSAPAFAGMLALVQQKVGSRIGLSAAQTLYDLFNGSQANAVFHDVTVGNNSVVCTAGTPNCVKNAAGNYFLADQTGSGYDTAAGYDLATGMGSVDVTQLIANWTTATGGGTATITVTPSATALTSLQSLTVAVTVAGSGGLGTPTGTVTLAGGGFSSPPTTLDATGAASFTITAGTLQSGLIALVATYSGDANYATTTGQATVTVTAVNYTITGTAPPAITPGNSGTSTLTISSNNGYAGSIALSCAVATTPTGAVDIPTCTVTSGTPVTLTSSVTSGTATVNFTTTAPIATLSRPRTGGWEGAGGAVLALLAIFGIPSRRRSWRTLLGMLVISVALFSLSACGGGGSSSGGGGGNGNPGTTAGTYTFTVTGTGTPAVDPVPTGPITLTVN